MAVGERERETLRVICRHPGARISPRWSSPRTWPAKWRRSPARSRSTAASPASSSTACRSDSTSSTATTGSRSGTASGRPAPRACGGTRWSAGRCSRCSPGSRRGSSAPSSTGSSSTGEIQQNEQEVTLGRRGALLPDEQDPDAAGRRRDHPRDHHRRGRDRLARGAGPDPAEREAGGDRPARRRRHARDQQPARHHRRLRRGHRGQAGGRTGDRGRARESTSRSSTTKSSAAAGSWTGCSTSAGRRASARRPLPLNAWWTRPCSCSSTTSASSGSRWCASSRPDCRRILGQRGAAHPGAHGADAQRGGRDGAGRAG